MSNPINVYEGLNNERLSNANITDKTMHMIILLNFYQKILDFKITEQLNLTIKANEETIKANEELENMHSLDMFAELSQRNFDNY